MAMAKEQNRTLVWRIPVRDFYVDCDSFQDLPKVVGGGGQQPPLILREAVGTVEYGGLLPRHPQSLLCLLVGATALLDGGQDVGRGEDVVWGETLLLSSELWDVQR